MKTEEKDTEELTHVAMFGSRNTIKEAFDYAKTICERSTKSDYIYTLTALMVIWNTLSDSYEPLIRKTNELNKNHTTASKGS